MNDRHFRLNEPDASTEDFETEILAVNLQNGHYHSLRGSAVPLWRLLMAGHGTSSIAGILATHYQTDPVTVRSVVENFADQLAAAGLAASTTPPAVPTPAPDWLAREPQAYSAPLLESYSDMEDILRLDPIHDVDTTGWPHTPGQAGNAGPLPVA